jgi:hypothetical protein
MVSYRRTQKGPWGLLLYAGAIVLLTVSWSVPNAPALPIALGVIGFVVLGTSFQQLTVVDEGRQLVIHFGPFPLFRRRIWYAEIIHAQQGRTTLLDGWGIHWNPWSGWVWNIWGFDCVVLRLEKGTLKIGTDDPEGLVEFLKIRMS